LTQLLIISLVQINCLRVLLKLWRMTSNSHRISLYVTTVGWMSTKSHSAKYANRAKDSKIRLSKKIPMVMKKAQ
jgi:hypothetical protein